MASLSDDGNYELVQEQDASSSPGAFTDDDIYTKPTLRLPPKLLPPRRHRDVALSFITPISITAFFLVALSVLLSQISRLLADIKTHSVGSILFTEAVSIKRLQTSPISCDLISPTASAFEKAFTIDLRSQLHLSFATAKFIDVVWDLVIGQGGRLLLAWISYVVFMDGLARLMETSAVSYQLYASSVFETTSLITTWYALKAVATGHGWRGRAFFAWFGFATLYVMGYSTLMSAATGYINPSNIRYRMRDDSLVAPDSEKFQHCLRINNGSAVGLADFEVVPGPSDKALEGFVGHLDEFKSAFPLFYTFYFRKFLIGTFHISNANIYTYPASSVWRSPLNDTNSRYESVMNFTVNGQTYQVPSNFFSASSEWYCYADEILPHGFQDSPICLAESYFAWGFSSLILYILLSLQLVWTLGMFLVWLDANVCSELCRKGRKMRGSFRNALDLAEAVREVLGDELCAYSEKEIERQLGKSRIGLQFYSTSDTDDGISHIGISSLKSGQRFHLHDKSLYGRPGRRRE